MIKPFRIGHDLLDKTPFVKKIQQERFCYGGFPYLRKLFWQGVWRQYDGEMITWDPWFWDGADGGRDANCAIITLSDDQHAGAWADEWCENPFYYICERDQ